MSDETGKSGGWWGVVLVLLLLPVLYVLSVGPVDRFGSRTGRGREAAIVFYAPLIWLHNNTPLQKPLDWYVDLWEK